MVEDLLLLVACAQRGAEGPDAESAQSIVQAQVIPTVVEPLSLVSIVPASTAVPIPRDCQRPVEETCNGLDDDCNGIIDDRAYMDLDNDGRSDGPADGFGYGKYPGQYGMALYSRYPIDREKARSIFGRDSHGVRLHR